MLVIATLERREGVPVMTVAARGAEWAYPEGVRVHGEYWCEGGRVDVVSIFEADDIEATQEIYRYWTDVNAMAIAPAITGEQGRETMARLAG